MKHELDCTYPVIPESGSSELKFDADWTGLDGEMIKIDRIELKTCPECCRINRAKDDSCITCGSSLNNHKVWLA